MTQILKGKTVAAELRDEVAAGVEQLLSAGHRRPGLTAVLVGDNPASQSYVSGKAKASQEVGIDGKTLKLPADIGADELLSHLDELNQDPAVDGILVQLPLPSGLPERRILDAVTPDKDVDGFHPVNVGRLWLDQPGLAPATPAGIIQLLKRSDIPLKGRHAVIVGRSAIVGKPMAGLLLREHCTVTVCHSRTRDLAAVCRQAEILIVAVGRPAFIGPEHVDEGAVVIDVGINRLDDPEAVAKLFPGNEKRQEGIKKRGYTLVGDVDYQRVLPRCSAITPVPGGVGPLTIAHLLVNTLQASRRRQGLDA